MGITRSTITASFLALLLGAGCFWGQGVDTDLVPETPAVPNGMALTLGDAAWNAASEQVSRTASETWSGDSLVFAGGETSDDPFVPSVTWEEAELELGRVDLAVDPLGVTVEVSAGMAPVRLVVSAAGRSLCEVEVGFDHGVLAGRLALTRTELGGVRARPAGTARFHAPEAWLDATSCPELSFGSFAPTDDRTGETSSYLDALAARAFEELAPELAEVVPEALGVDISTTSAFTWGDDGIGHGTLRALVRASEADTDQWWQVAGGRMVVPYAVAVDASHHPCVPDQPLPSVPPAPLPAVEADAAVLVHEALVRRSLVAFWRSGALCGERAFGGVSWRAGDLAGLWPALAALDPDGRVTARLWPGGAPDARFEATADGVRTRITAQGWSVELMGRIDEADVRLATLRLDLRMTADVVPEPKQHAGLAPVDVFATAIDVEAGLLEAPEAAIAEALAVPVARDLVGHLPALRLPPLPSGPASRVGIQGAYLVFSDGGSGDVDRGRDGP